MRLFLAGLLLFGCASTQNKFTEDLNNIVQFRADASSEFNAFWATAYKKASDLSVVDQIRVIPRLRVAMVRFLILLDELDGCIAGAKRTEKVLGNGEGLTCARVVIGHMVSFLRVYGISPPRTQIQSIIPSMGFGDSFDPDRGQDTSF